MQKSGASFFWHFQGLAERTLFYWMLADVGKDFFLNWTSMLMAANGCNGPYAGYCEFKVPNQVIGGAPTEMLIAALPDCHGVLSDIRAIYVPQGLSCSIGYNVKARPWGPINDPSATLISYIRDSDTGDTWAGAQQGTPGSGDTGVVGFHKGIPGAPVGYKRLSLVGQSSSFSYIEEGTIQVTLSGREVKIFSPPNCFKNLTDKAFDKWIDGLVS